jgi:hypothetical protein
MGTALLKTMRKDSTTAYLVRLDERRRADARLVVGEKRAN